MTIENVIAAVQDFSNEPVTAETKLKDVVSDSLDFVDLILHVSNKCGNVPDELVPRIETVKDLFMAVQ